MNKIIYLLFIFKWFNLFKIIISDKYYSNKYYIIQINLKTYIIIKTIYYKITWNKNKAKILVVSVKEKRWDMLKVYQRWNVKNWVSSGEDGENENEEIWS